MWDVRCGMEPEPPKPLNDAQMCGSFYFARQVVLVHIDSKGRGKERLRWLYEAKFVFDCPVLFFFEKSLVISNKSSIFAALEPAKPLNDAQMCGSFFLCYA